MKNLLERFIERYGLGWVALVPLAVIATLTLYAILHAVTPPSEEDQFISAVKQVRSADGKIEFQLTELKTNAQNIASSYKTIAETGNGSRVYSRYDFEFSTGSITISLRDHAWD